MLRKRLLPIIMTAVFMLVAGSAMAATSVQWTSPADGSSYPVGTAVAPTGLASGTGTTGSGLDLSLIIDTSGSMGITKMNAAKAAAIALVNALPADSTSVAVVGFNSYSHVYEILTPLNPDKAVVIAAINSLSAGGGTNIGVGITAATSTILTGHTAGRAMMEVVISDGASASGYVAAATAAAAAGITVHSVGIPGHSVPTMQQIAAAGGGIYTDASNLATLTALFDGTGGNIVGIDYVDIELADGTWINNIAMDGLGNFILPSQLIALGANTFTAHAYGTDGTYASAELTLNGTNAVPEPATMLLFGTGLAGLVAARRRKVQK